MIDWGWADLPHCIFAGMGRSDQPRADQKPSTHPLAAVAANPRLLLSLFNNLTANL